MFFGKKEIIGLDIGSKHIKAVQLKEARGTYTLERLGITTLEPDLIVDGSILDSSRVVEAINELISNTDIKVKDVTLSVSGHSYVIIKRVALPRMTQEELEESITFEAEQYIPFDIDDVTLDFQILGMADDNMMDVLIAAVKKDKTNEYVNAVKEAGLNPVIVDVDAFALENMYEINYEVNEAETVALVNIGASTINMNIIREGISVFTRDSSSGSNLHTDALQRELSISYQNAEKLKQRGSIEGVSEEDMNSVLAVASKDIAREIARSFDYFRDTTSYDKIDKIILSGGGALTDGFVPILSKMVGVDVEIVEPFKNIKIPETFDKEYLKKIESLVAVAVGLALRRIGD